MINVNEWCKYLGQLVVAPDGDSGILKGVHFDSGLCINCVWWGDRSNYAKWIETRDKNQTKLELDENKD